MGVASCCIGIIYDVLSCFHVLHCYSFYSYNTMISEELKREKGKSIINSDCTSLHKSMNSKVYSHQNCISYLLLNYSVDQYYKRNYSIGIIFTIELTLSFTGWESGRCLEENGGTHSSLFKETVKYEWTQKPGNLIKSELNINVEEREEFRLGRYNIHSTGKKLCTTHAGGYKGIRDPKCFILINKTATLEILLYQLSFAKELYTVSLTIQVLTHHHHQTHFFHFLASYIPKCIPKRIIVYTDQININLVFKM